MPEIAILNDFTGGWNTDKSSGNFSEKELELADNADYSERGSVKKRSGVIDDEGPFEDEVKRILEWPKSNGQTEILVVLKNGELVRVKEDENIFEIFGTHITWFVLKEYLYLVDGNNYYRIDDESFNYEEVPEKDTSGLEEYAEKFEAELGESFDLEYDDIESDSVKVTLYSDPDTDFEESKDYEVNYEDGKVTPLEDEDMEDGENYYIEYEYEVESDNNLEPIRKCKYIIRHPKSYRIFAAGNPDDPSALYYSEYNEPDYFKGKSALYPTTNDGPIQGLEIVDDMLLVFFKKSIWAWRGIDPEQDAVWEKIPVKHGTFNHRTLEIIQGSITFIDDNGLYALDSSKGLQNLTDNKVANVIKDIDNRNEIHSIYDSSNNRYMLAYSEEQGDNDKILTLDFEIGAYARWTGLEVNDFCYTQDGELLIAEDEYIKKIDKDSDEEINFNIKSAKMNLKNPYNYKMIDDLFLTLSNFSDNTKLNIYLDGEKTSFDVKSKILRQKIADKGVEIQVEIEDNSPENIVLYDFGLEFKPVKTYRSEL